MQAIFSHSHATGGPIFFSITMTLLLLLCATQVPLASAWSLPQALIDYSFAVCESDELCSLRFSLVAYSGNTELDRRATFDEIYALALTSNRPIVDSLTPLVMGCLENTSSDNCWIVQETWLAVLRNMQPCPHVNEVWQYSLGCVCQQGKHCDDCSVGIKISDPLSWWIALMLLFFAVFLHHTLSARHLHRVVESIRRFARSVSAGEQIRGSNAVPASIVRPGGSGPPVRTPFMSMGGTEMAASARQL